MSIHKIESSLSGEYIRYLMRRNGHTIKSIAKSMDITQKRVRYVRANGVTGNAYVLDWAQALTS